jgi:uncharacterized protein with NRDE domain
MCTLVFAWQAFPDVPIAVAANRDEAVDRPSSPPTVWETDPAILAPRDESAGGTWIGYNEAAVFAGITNRWIEESLPAERSRGYLVRDALGAQSAETGARLIERALDRHSYDGFNLLIADQTAAIYMEWDGTLSIRNFDPGVHVVVNVGADGQYRIPNNRAAAGREQADNAGRIRARLQPDPGECGRTWLDRAATTIADHEYGVCIHEESFGTRSSSVLSLGTEKRVYRYADGPPCETEYERVEGQV